MASQTLLLVDSDARSMRMLEVSLRKAGFEVVMARDGAEAMAAIERHTPDLILSDTRLPPPIDDATAPRDGYEFCERLKGDDGHTRIPFIFLTGSGDLEDKIRGLKLGVEDYLTKPIYLKELLTRVQLVLARKRRDSLNASARARFVGELAGMGLIDLLTTVDLGRKTGVIEIDGPEGAGSLTFRDGVVIDAKSGRARGERAVFRMLRWSDGRFEVRFGAATAPDDVERTVTLGTQGLMLEGLRRADEWNHAETRLGGALESPWVIDREAEAQAGDGLDESLRALVARFQRPRSIIDAIDEGTDDLADLYGLVDLAQKGILHRAGGPRVAMGAAETGRPTVPGFAANLSASIDEAMSFLEGPEATVPHTGAIESGTNAAKTPPENEAPDARTSKPATPDPARIEAPPPGRDARDARKTNQERDVAKHKQKRQKGNRDSGAPARPSSGPPGATVVTPKDAPLAQPVAVATARADTGITDKGLRVEGNVIHLPSSVEPVASPSDADDSGAHPAAKSDGESDISALREGPGERERTTLPPDEKADAKTETKTEAKADAKVEEKTEAKTDEKTDEKVETKADEKAAIPELRSLTPTERPGPKVEEKISAKPDDKASQGRSSKADILTTRKEGKGREHKESLSTHLSDEARAFFSEQAYQAAYKADHDSFEDLAPAHEEHPSEIARSRRWMTAAGGVFVALLIVVVGFAAYHSRYAVHETALDTTQLTSHANEPVTPPEAQHAQHAQPAPQPEAQPPTPPAATPPAAGPEAQPPTAAPPAAGPEAQPPTAAPPAAGPETQPPTVAPPTPPVAAPPVAAPPVAAPPVAAPPAAAPPTGQTPAQLLAAARTFRGALAGRIAAYNAYFDAAPTDDRTMTTFAMSLAEMNRNVDAEQIAARATTANPRNAQAWFVLAYSRNAQHNVAGSREAKTRCIELGGQWAAECRSL